eukprot:1204500-Amphidinium_carterae.1
MSMCLAGRVRQRALQGKWHQHRSMMHCLAHALWHTAGNENDLVLARIACALLDKEVGGTIGVDGDGDQRMVPRCVHMNTRVGVMRIVPHSVEGDSRSIFSCSAAEHATDGSAATLAARATKDMHKSDAQHKRRR